MKRAKTYAIYSSFEDPYIKLLSIDGLNNGKTSFKLNIKEYVPTIDKVLENNIDVICKNDEIEFYCNDDTKFLNFRVGNMPKNWSSVTQYVPGNTVYYNGKVYTLKNRVNKGAIPTNTDWSEAVDYSNKAYLQYEVVLWSDGNYYVANSSIAANENPSNSNKWVKVSGEFSLYCGINGNGAIVETTILLGDENQIQLYPYTSEIYYTNDESNTTINGATVNISRLYTYSNVYVSTLKPLSTNFNKLILTKATGDVRKYFKIMKIKMVKNTSLFFTVKAENLYMGEKNVYGICRVSLIGDNSSINAVLRPVNLTADFIKENINFHIRRATDGTVYLYAAHTGNSFKFTIEDILDMSRSSESRYLSSALIEIYNNPTEVSSIDDVGTAVENLYW